MSQGIGFTSSKELAELAGVSLQTVYNYLRDGTLPQPVMLIGRRAWPHRPAGGGQ